MDSKFSKIAKIEQLLSVWRELAFLAFRVHLICMNEMC